MLMYEQHFGLNKRPFRATASGSDVFVGPHIAETIAGINKSLTANDAIVTISGAVGSGKTTIAMRALESISGERVIVRIARMRLGSEDVLDFLLDELGIEDKPRGTIQRFAILRRKLKELEESNTRVFVAIEDSVRLGADTLAEIEALTSADAGVSEGANVILMGDDSLQTLLGESALARINQRVRKPFTINPLSATELHGYLRHCFRLVGGDFEKVFETNAAEVLHHLSGGIPRISNNLVESAMKAAADQGLERVTSVLMSQVAADEYGLSTVGIDLTPPVDPQTKQASLTVLVAALPAEPELLQTTSPSPRAPVEEPAAAPAEADIPHLIQDTQPDLKILAPDLATAELLAEADLAVEPTPEPTPVSVAEPVADPIPELVVKPIPEPIPEPVAAPAPELIVESVPELIVESAPEPEAVAEPAPEPVLELSLESEAEPQSAAESAGDEVPAWDLDPTMAELRPDLAALEQAMAFAQGAPPTPAAENEEPVPAPTPEAPEVIPEITLDNAINERIESQLLSKASHASSLESEDAPADSTEANTTADTAPQAPDNKANAEMQKIATELSMANSIEDIDDKLAETLFGEEMNQIAAQFMANPPPVEPDANGDEAVGSVAAVEEPTKGHQNPVSAGEVPAATRKIADTKDINVTASARLRTVMALNSDPKFAASKPKAKPAAKPARKPGATARNHLPTSDAPASFEDQSSALISETQTRKVLEVAPPEDDEEIKTGFFNRFKRS